MPCYRPNMMLFDTSKRPKQQLKFVSANSKNFVGYEYFDAQNAFFKSLQGLQYHKGQEWIRVPCGQCIGCQEAYSRQWAIRCMLEAERFEYNYFLTLTYNDVHLPRDVEIVNKDTGEIGECSELGSLNRPDLQKFMKRLRKYFKDHFDFPESVPDYYEDDVSDEFLTPSPGIRFYACGEYGTEGQRPHYHVILFNCPIPKDDLTIHKMTKDGNIIFNSKIIEKCWSDENGSIGFSSLAEVNWDTCAYTARYCLKKVKGKPAQDYYFNRGQVPEFTSMSLRPAIGLNFFNENFIEIYENDEMIIKGHKEKIQPVKPVKFYDKKYQAMFPDEYDALVVKRKHLMLNNTKLKQNNTTLSEREQLKVEEEAKKSQMSIFKLQRDKF